MVKSVMKRMLLRAANTIAGMFSKLNLPATLRPFDLSAAEGRANERICPILPSVLILIAGMSGLPWTFSIMPRFHSENVLRAAASNIIEGGVIKKNERDRRTRGITKFSFSRATVCPV